MTESNNQSTIKKIGIIGGGKIGLSMFELFSKSHISQVNYVVDIDSDAPALLAAKKAGVAVFQDIQKVLSQEVDFIIEVTGSSQVIDIILNSIENCNIKLITHDMAYVLMQAIEENTRDVRKEAVSEFIEIESDISESAGGIKRLVDNIDTVTSEMTILALNARIEAARAGEQGRSFAVVAQQMANSANSVKDIAQEIKEVNQAIESTSMQIEAALAKLK